MKNDKETVVEKSNSDVIYGPEFTCVTYFEALDGVADHK